VIVSIQSFLPPVLTFPVDVRPKSLRASVPSREPVRARQVPQLALSLEALHFFDFVGKQARWKAEAARLFLEHSREIGHLLSNFSANSRESSHSQPTLFSHHDFSVVVTEGAES